MRRHKRIVVLFAVVVVLGGILYNAHLVARDRLLDAIDHGTIAGVATCLLLGADPDVCDASRSPAIHLALDHNRPRVVRLLLRFGADPDGREWKPA